VVDHLSELGLTMVGYDISLGMLAQARRAFPHLRFDVGDLEALDVADASLGGIVARYSLIHVPPARLASVFDEWLRLLEPGAPVLVAFFAASAAEAHGSPFDHLVATAYELFPATIATQLEDAGFTIVEIVMRDAHPGERPLAHATLLAITTGL
jgi:ubiquinone/menaquinone biosynthesis C-methylase UbiE